MLIDIRIAIVIFTAKRTNEEIREKLRKIKIILDWNYIFEIKNSQLWSLDWDISWRKRTIRIAKWTAVHEPVRNI